MVEVVVALEVVVLELLFEVEDAMRDEELDVEVDTLVGALDAVVETVELADVGVVVVVVREELLLAEDVVEGASTELVCDDDVLRAP